MKKRRKLFLPQGKRTLGRKRHGWIIILKGNLEKLCVREEYRPQRNAVGWYGTIYCNEQLRR